MREALDRFLTEFAAQRRGSPHTLAAYRRDVTRVLDLAAGPGRKVDASQWSRELLERALRELYRSGHSSASAARALAAWRSFSRFCLRRGVIASDPARPIRFPRLSRRLPRTLPSNDLGAALDRIPGEGAVPVRDRALLEVAYSSGLRVSELTGLDLGAIDFSTREARITGKGGKTRIVPVG
ncbi:MAG: site-specific integrase, partial [Candidatus Eisenbacteria bacterium]|nr:site-specific integrase [Candidatus Eisenbacteria bacterium]